MLTAITCDPALVRAADAAGVDRVGIDIERLGKSQRQRHLPNARLSDHRLEQLASVAANATRAEIFVRLNPLHDGSQEEIDRALALGARALMLPYFSGPREVACFVEMVGGRGSPVLLLETAAAVVRLRDIVAVKGVTEIVVGLNDLHGSLGLANHFEVVVTDLMTMIADRVREAGLRFGFGGLARVDDATLPVPPDLVCAQYPRLGATSAWLSRSFFHGLGPGGIAPAVHALRERLDHWKRQPASALLEQREELALVLRRIGEGRL
ncbi:MAG: aldolase/citrate lyase family protein [Thermoanaerobaculia bacterium]